MPPPKASFLKGKAKGSIFVYSLVMVSLVMLIAVVTQRLAFLKENIQEARAASLLEEIEGNSVFNRFLLELRQGKVVDAQNFQARYSFQGRDYKLEDRAIGGRLVKVEVVGAHSRKEWNLHIQPASDFFQIFSKGISLSGAKDQQALTGPIYAPFIKLSLENGPVTLNLPVGVSVPPLVSKSKIEVTGTGSLFLTGKSPSANGGIFTNVIAAGELGDVQNRAPLRSEIGRANLALSSLCEPVGDDVGTGDFPEVVKIPNPYLNRKKKLGVASGLDGETLRLRDPEVLAGSPRVYFLAPERAAGYVEGDLVDSFASVDSVNAPPSFRVIGEALVMNAAEETYPLPLTREMFLGRSLISLGIPGKVVISSGRNISALLMDGVPTSYTYDPETRVLSLGNTPYLKALFRGDGRKSRYSLRELGLSGYPALLFENGKPKVGVNAVAGDGSQEIEFSPPPAYGALVEAAVSLPDLRVKKNPLKRGTVVLADQVVEAKKIEVSRRFKKGLHFGGSEQTALLLTGQMKADLSLKTAGDIYIGALTNAGGYTLFIDCRYIFLAKGSEAGDLRRVVIRQSGEQIFSMSYFSASLKGTFIFDQEKKSGGNGGSPSEVSQVPMGFASPKLQYDESFVGNPFQALFFYRIL